MKEYDTFLFDWDGTLARTLELWIEQIGVQFDAYGLKATKAQLVRDFGDLKSPLKYGLPEHLLTGMQEAVNEAVRRRLPDVPLFDDADVMLRLLKAKGKRVALITTSLRPLLHIVLRNHGLEGLFDLIVTSEDVKTHKPDPEGINFAISHLGADKARTIMLGDSGFDLLAAKNAGIDSALFYPEPHEVLHDLTALQAHGPKYTVRAWKELIDQLQ
jgi:pyrophosphatase PpaX